MLLVPAFSKGARRKSHNFCSRCRSRGRVDADAHCLMPPQTTCLILYWVHCSLLYVLCFFVFRATLKLAMQEALPSGAGAILNVEPILVS